jgi:hypothetical protein
MNNKYYEDEKLKFIPFVMFIFGIALMVVLTVIKITDPDNWAPYGYLVGMGFMFFWTWIAFAVAYYMTIKPRNAFIKERNSIINKGTIEQGEIVDTKQEVRVYTNGQPSSWRYYAEVRLDNGNTFWTKSLLINPKNLETNEVTVYMYNNKYYVTDFKISNNPINEEVQQEEINNYDNDYDLNIFECVMSIISGVIFTGFTGWVFIAAADMATRIIIIPFVICGIGVLLRGLVPLIFKNKKKKFKNIGMRIYLTGFSLFWFGFLIFFDYGVLQQGNIGLFLFSLLFWIAGIFILRANFKAFK